MVSHELSFSLLICWIGGGKKVHEAQDCTFSHFQETTFFWQQNHTSYDENRYLKFICRGVSKISRQFLGGIDKVIFIFVAKGRMAEKKKEKMMEIIAFYSLSYPYN